MNGTVARGGLNSLLLCNMENSRKRQKRETR